jgi:hypothetical protein
MDLDSIPNLSGLVIEDLIDHGAGPGEKTTFLDFSKIDYTDKREVPLSWKCLKTFDDACAWYANECGGKYPEAIIPYLVKKSIEPAMVKKKKRRKKRRASGYKRRFGRFNVKFK